MSECGFILSDGDELIRTENSEMRRALQVSNHWQIPPLPTIFICVIHGNNVFWAQWSGLSGRGQHVHFVLKDKETQHYRCCNPV